MVREDKRLWIYSGLAVPEGVAATRKAVYRTEPRRGALLIGRDLPRVRSLVQLLSRLPMQQLGELVVDLRADSGSIPGPAELSWLGEQLELLHPDTVMLAWSPPLPELREQIESHPDLVGVRVIWLADPGVFAPGCVSAPVRGSASEVAGWASQVWDVIR